MEAAAARLRREGHMVLSGSIPYVQDHREQTVIGQVHQTVPRVPAHVNEPPVIVRLRRGFERADLRKQHLFHCPQLRLDNA